MTSKLLLEPRIEDPDGFYSSLIEMHRDLSPDQSQVVNAKLILLLANHIGDRQVLDEAITLAGSAPAGSDQNIE